MGVFANLRFGRTIVGMWRVSVATELGEGGRVTELARNIHPEVISPSRQSVYWADLGRGLVTERRTRDQGVQALIQAEQPPRKESTTTRSSAKQSPTCCARHGATLAAASYAAWPGA